MKPIVDIIEYDFATFPLRSVGYFLEGSNQPDILPYGSC
jgi:hypothetical protein